MDNITTSTVPVVNVDNILEAIDNILGADSSNCFSDDFTSSGDNQWATEIAIMGILNQQDPEEIASLIIREWEPSDDEMIANNSCGTAWHDGCR
jgi:hypothetical protein